VRPEGSSQPGRRRPPDAISELIIRFPAAAVHAALRCWAGFLVEGVVDGDEVSASWVEGRLACIVLALPEAA
jgi:hypothetical protein